MNGNAIDSKLNFDCHVVSISMKASQKLSVLGTFS